MTANGNHVEPNPSSPSQGDNCVFVANLPQRLTNWDLAQALCAIFQPFGEIVSVKASRDKRGRPFGFIEFAHALPSPVHEQDAAETIWSSPRLMLDGRRLRVEPAMCQRKIGIRITLDREQRTERNGIEIEEVIEEVRQELAALARPEDIKLNLSADGSTLAAVVKFEDVSTATSAFNKWMSDHGQQWILTWINTDRMSSYSNIRNSGLVQLVPSRDSPAPGGGGGGPFMPSPFMAVPSPYASHTTGWYAPFGYTSTPLSLFDHHHQHPYMNLWNSPMTSPSPVSDQPPIIPPPLFEELILRKSSEETAVSEDDSWDLERAIFIGRLNSRQVTFDSVVERFERYGNVCRIRLYNRGVAGVDGDAFGFVFFDEQTSIERAVANENGTVWLGQTIKCERVKATTIAASLSFDHPATVMGKSKMVYPAAPKLSFATLPEETIPPTPSEAHHQCEAHPEKRARRRYKFGQHPEDCAICCPSSNGHGKGIDEQLAAVSIN